MIRFYQCAPKSQKTSTILNYRPQTKFAKVKFLYVSVYPHGGVSAPLHAGIHPPGQTPPLGRHPPWADTPLGRHPPGQTPPWADTPLGRHPLGSACWDTVNKLFRDAYIFYLDLKNGYQITNYYTGSLTEK